MRSPDQRAAPTAEDHLKWLVELQRFGMHPGLARVHALLAAIGTPQRTFDVVLVAGTNGKGSTASALSGFLRAAGLRTCLFISPHLSTFGVRYTAHAAVTGLYQ